MSQWWFLKGEMGDHSPWNVPLNKADYILGRSPDCDLVVNDNSVSRKHCRISLRHDEPWVSDMESRNGTYLNGIKLDDERPLRDGDVIKLGRVEFTLSRQQEVEDSDKTIFDNGMAGQQSFTDRFKLSDREAEIFYLLLKGGSVKDIAEKLFISPGTAKNHVLKIYKKTGTHSRIELATLYHQSEKE